MEQMNKLNNLILEQIIRFKMLEQVGPPDEVADDEDLVVVDAPIKVITDPDAEAKKKAKKKADADAAEKKRIEAKKKADENNMKAARSFSTAYKNSTGATVDFAKPVKVDGNIPSYTSSSFKVGDIT